MADTIYSAKQFQSGYSGLSHAGIASFLERSFTAAQQTEITNIIKAKEIEVCNACGRNFLVDNAVYQEILDGGFNEFEPLNFPVASISKIYIAGQDVTSQFIENTNYFIYDDHIEFDEFLTATENRKAVKIEYKISKFWGDDIVDLIKKMVALEVLSKTEGGVNMAAKSFAEITKNFDLKTFEKQKEDLISSYQVIPV